MRVRFTSSEFEYLRARNLLAGDAIARAMPVADGGCLIDMATEEADGLRDAVGEELQRVGFDEKYHATAEGSLLEALVDKLLVR